MSLTADFQAQAQTIQPAQEHFSQEIKPNDIAPEFLEKWNWKENSAAPQAGKEIRIVYLVPSDKTIRNDYKNAITESTLNLQEFYKRELGNNRTFSLHSPIVEVYQSARPASWFATNPSRVGAAPGGWFWENTLNEGFALSGGRFNDPNNRWVYYIDADTVCGQVIGGNGGVAVMAANDFRGLLGEQNVPACANQSPDNSPRNRWIGGAGHELAHTFNVPHPPGCGSGSPNYGCNGGATAANSLMWVGYAFYPNTYFLPEDKTTLLNSGFFSAPSAGTRFDFDGDGKAEVAVFRPSNGVWYRTNSASNSFSAINFGQAADSIAPADYDGDGKTDIAVFRQGTWYRLNSSNDQFVATQFGTNGDIPLPADYDGDSKADLAVFRPSNGTWYRINSSNNQSIAVNFGLPGDKPQIGDFDRDGKSDLAVFRPSNGAWYILQSSNNSFFATTFGIAEDIPTPADFDGDGKTDIAVFRPSQGTWYRINSATNQFAAMQFGVGEDKPVAADYDGDGKSDIAVFRPSTGSWYVLRSTQGFFAQHFGLDGDVPISSAFRQ